MRVHADRIVGNTTRFRQSRFFERQMLGHPMKTTLRHTHKSRHRAMHPVSETESVWIEIILTCAHERRIEIEHRSGLADHAIPFAKFPDSRAGLRDHSAKLMSELLRLI